MSDLPPIRGPHPGQHPYGTPGWPPPGRTLGYASFGLTRPGLLTALGVCSIVLGSLGVLFNGVSVLTGAVAMTVNVEPTPWLAGTSDDTTPPGALGAPDPARIVLALARLEPMNEDERSRLREALPLVESPLAPPLEGQPWSATHVLTQVVASATDESESGREVHFDFSINGDIWIMQDRIEFLALPMEGGSVITTVWRDGRIEVDDQRYVEPEGLNALLWAVVLGHVTALLLAVVLIVAGIQTLRDRPGAARLHRLWAWSRIALTVLMTLLVLLALALDRRGVELVFGETAWWFFGAGVFVWGLLLAVYPIGVLIVLRSVGVRQWYEAGIPRQAAPAAQPHGHG